MAIDRSNLFNICRNHVYFEGDAVVSEPYIPFFPNPQSKWNGILVVAIAQNLSDTNDGYRAWLEESDQQVKWDRLNTYFASHGDIGVGPWDDGTIKLAVAALRGGDAVTNVAVSNAVLWSGRESGANESLTKKAVFASINVWREMIEILAPTEVLAFGAKARNVMRLCGLPKNQIIGLPGPFSRNYNIRGNCKMPD